MRHRYCQLLRAKVAGQIEAAFLIADLGSQFHSERRSDDIEYGATHSFRNYTTAKFSYYIEGEKRENLTGKIQKGQRKHLLSIKRREKWEM